MLPITSFVVAWLETWFLDFKVLTQEADNERGEWKMLFSVFLWLWVGCTMLVCTVLMCMGAERTDSRTGTLVLQ